MRRLGDDERPLQILNEYLTNLGFEDPWRVQEEGMNPEIGCLIRFYFGEHFIFSEKERHLLSVKTTVVPILIKTSCSVRCKNTTN